MGGRSAASSSSGVVSGRSHLRKRRDSSGKWRSVGARFSGAAMSLRGAADQEEVPPYMATATRKGIQKKGKTPKRGRPRTPASSMSDVQRYVSIFSLRTSRETQLQVEHQAM